MTEKVLEILAQQSPGVVALLWAVWYFGQKIDRLTQAVHGVKEKVAVLLDRERARE